MKRLFVIFLLLMLVGSGPSRGQEKIDLKIPVLAEDFKTNQENQMMRAYLRKEVHAALDRRLETVEKLETEEQIAAYQKGLREFFRETTGLDTIERNSPLNAETTGRLERDAYTIEKVVFESQPDFHVTGNLYLPSSRGPHPAILHACGHTENGKAGDVYQMVNILLVKQGFVVLCYDPIGQGERKQLINKDGKPTLKGSGEHMALGVAPILLGRGLSTYMIHDGIRAIDYLQSRPEVDPARIGCTGNSGGGNMTSFLMALDDRIQVAAPGCFMTTTRMKNESPGPGDAEQNLFAQIRDGLDHPDFAIIRAPKPTLILAATHDFVPIDGTWDAFRQTKRIYTKLGFPERVDLIEAPEKHGYSKRLREGSARFFCRWLKGDNVEIFEPVDVAVEKEADLLCTPQGQVLWMKGERSMLDLNAEAAEQFAQSRAEAWKSFDITEQRSKIREVTGIRGIKDLPTTKSEVRGGIMRNGSGAGFTEFSEAVYETEPGIKIPVCRLHSQSHSGPGPDHVHLVCVDEKWEGHPPDRAFELLPKNALQNRGQLIVANLRDSGFSKTKNWRFYGADAFIAYMLGKSYLAMRTEDLLMLARDLGSEGQPMPIHLHADAEFVPVAIHAAALEPDFFESITLHGGLTTWQTVIESRDPMPHFHNVVHGALLHYDLKDLLEMIPAGKLKVLP